MKRPSLEETLDGAIGLAILACILALVVAAWKVVLF